MWLVLTWLGLNGCSQSNWPDRSPQIVDSVAVTRLNFWPSGLRYAQKGDTLRLSIHGLQRGVLCASVLSLNAVLSSSGTDAILQLKSKIELPGDADCPLDGKGLDTSITTTPNVPRGTQLILQTPGGLAVDTVWFLATQAYPETLSVLATLVATDTGTPLPGRFNFEDSTAAHPIRVLATDSLLPCETLNGAVYERAGDSLRVYFPRLLLDSLQTAGLNPDPCRQRNSDTTVFHSDSTVVDLNQ